MKQVLTIIGTRPQFIGAADVSRAFSGTTGVCEPVVHADQHFNEDMPDVFFEELGIPAPARWPR